MKLDTKFDLEQQVWAIGNRTYCDDVIDACVICNRSGRVILKGEELICPKCNGRSVPPQWSIQVWNATIVRVETNHTVASKAGPWDNRNSYRLDTVGDGTVWPEDRLFLSEKEAEVECSRRNAAIAERGE
jgi:Zn finger protein HypA/HybF involved in hydrogenase expression